MQEKIQIINYLKSDEIKNIKFNRFQSPESFDDYEINVIDMSHPDLWWYKSSYPESINIDKDLLSLGEMIKVSSSKILVLLPQNIPYLYNFSNSLKRYQNRMELKDILSILDKAIHKILSNEFKKSIIMYNKTVTKIQDVYINSDFVFLDNDMGDIITKSNNQQSITTIQFNKVYLTTLNLSFDNYKNLFLFLQKLNWLSQEEQYPDWLAEEKFLNDDILLETNKFLLQEKCKIEQKISDNYENLNKNLFYKSILFATGDQLVNVVNHMLDEMIGYDYEKFEDLKEEDFRIEKQNCVLIGEIKGINTNVKRSTIMQTSLHRDLYLEIEGNENKSVYAIAIINRERKKRLSERTEIHQDIIKVAKMNNVLLINSETLLKLYEKFRNNEINQDEILDLFKGKGLLKIK